LLYERHLHIEIWHGFGADLAAGGEQGDGEGGAFEDGVLGLRSLSSTGLVEAVVFGGGGDEGVDLEPQFDGKLRKGKAAGSLRLDMVRIFWIGMVIVNGVSVLLEKSIGTREIGLGHHCSSHTLWCFGAISAHISSDSRGCEYHRSSQCLPRNLVEA
jgi:hypothetical protein